ncbi:MAG: hypothetical protein JW772_02245, partial [Candidatus Diapherotrites archaeon]|nr:hypothetical protein [Candidatus Diapherotrites archaeon]
MNSGNLLPKPFLNEKTEIVTGCSGSRAMITHENDPLLTTKTANELIEEKNLGLLFLKNGEIINWYSALVRPGDFVKTGLRNSVLQKTVYASGKNLASSLQKFIGENNISAKDAHSTLEYYTGVRINLKDSSKWFSQSCFPLVYLRAISLFARDSEFVLACFLSSVDYFTDFLGKSKLFVEKEKNFIFTKRFAYLAGCSAGDGHISPDSRRWVLVDGTPHEALLGFSREFEENLGELLAVNINSFKIRQTGKKFELIVNNKSFCRFLNFFYGLPIGPKKKQSLRRPKIFDLSENRPNLLAAFWRGCFDTDGSVSVNGSLDFASINQLLLSDLKSDFNGFGIALTTNSHSVTVSLPDFKKFTKIGFAHPRKKSIFLRILHKGPKFLLFRGVNPK